MYKNILGNYTINISPAQAKIILELLGTRDIYEMSVGDYMEHAVLQSKVEEITEQLS